MSALQIGFQLNDLGLEEGKEETTRKHATACLVCGVAPAAASLCSVSAGSFRVHELVAVPFNFSV
jgi:hypothetical protein